MGSGMVGCFSKTDELNRQDAKVAEWKKRLGEKRPNPFLKPFSSLRLLASWRFNSLVFFLGLITALESIMSQKKTSTDEGRGLPGSLD
jgi:hypothetical protein